MSGLSSSVAAVPYELKLEIRLPVEFGKVPRSVPHVSVVGPIDPVPKADRLTELVREHCATQSSPA